MLLGPARLQKSRDVATFSIQSSGLVPSWKDPAFFSIIIGLEEDSSLRNRSGDIKAVRPRTRISYVKFPKWMFQHQRSSACKNWNELELFPSLSVTRRKREVKLTCIVYHLMKFPGLACMPFPNFLSPGLNHQIHHLDILLDLDIASPFYFLPHPWQRTTTCCCRLRFPFTPES